MDLTEAIEGEWWEPARSDNRVHGKVDESNDALRLSLEDSLSADTDEADTGNIPAIPVLHGQSGGDRITLLGCHRTNWNVFGSGPEKWRTNTVIVGRHLDSAEDPISDVTFRYGPLLSWAGDPTGLAYTGRTDQELTVTSTQQTIGTATVNAETIELIIGHSVRTGNTQFSIERDASITVRTTRSDLSIRHAVDAYGLAFRDLLALTSRSYVSLDSVTFHTQDDTPAHHGPAARLFTRVQRPNIIPEPVGAFTMIFNRKEFAIPFETLLPAWLSLWARHRHTINLIVVPTYAPRLYTDTLLHNMWIAVEGYHRDAMQQTDEAAAADNDAHHKRVDAIVANAPDEHKAWTEQQLRGKNTIGQTLKLGQLIIRAGATGAALVSANPRYVKYATSARGKTAHPATITSEEGPQFLFLANTLRWLLTHCLLVDLGVPDTKVAERITANREFQFDIASVAEYH